MSWKSEWRILALVVGGFLVCHQLPLEGARFQQALVEALLLVRWYAREHVLLCLVPAFFIAGAIAVFVGKEAVMRYLGPRAPRALAYGVAAVSGSILAVCSCTVLPLFAGIYRLGAGLGPATAFLYAGPAINILAVILTARVLGVELGIARAVGAIVFSIVIGLLMHVIFRHERDEEAAPELVLPEAEGSRPLWRTALYFASMVGILVFANWGAPAAEAGFWWAVYSAKWWLTGLSAAALGGMLIAWFGLPWRQVLLVAAPVGALALWPEKPADVAARVGLSVVDLAFIVGVAGLSLVTGRRRDECGEWLAESWSFAKQILPLLLLGVLLAGALLGRPGHEGLIPDAWVEWAVGGDSPRANFLAAFAGAFMYFATLTEIPILEGLIGAGMGKGPALALLLAGPALSLPNMLVIRGVLGTKKTVVFVTLVVVMATLSGMIFGAI